MCSNASLRFGVSPLPWIELGYKKKAHIPDDPYTNRRVRWFWNRVKAGEDIRFIDFCVYVRAQVPTKGKT